MKGYRNEILPAVLLWKLGIVETITLSKTTVIKENIAIKISKTSSSSRIKWERYCTYFVTRCLEKMEDIPLLHFINTSEHFTSKE